MSPLMLGVNVKIKSNSAKAKIVAIHQRMHGSTIYLCRYTDTSGRIAEDWMYAEEVELITE